MILRIDVVAVSVEIVVKVEVAMENGWGAGFSFTVLVEIASVAGWWFPSDPSCP